VPSPDISSVRAQLERILASEGFANAGRLARLLRYTVEQTLEGQGDRLKEYVLGVEVFDRRDGYDPRLDSIVRVEVRRLRAKLAEYYQNEGASDPVLIRLRKGSYAPVFEPRSGVWPREVRPGEVGPGLREPSGEPGTSSNRLSPILGLLVLGCIAAGFLFIRGFAGSGEPEPQVPFQLVTVAVLPFKSFSTDANQQLLADRVSDGVMTRLARFPSLGVRSRTSVMPYRDVRRPLREIARELDTDLVVEGSVAAEGRMIRVETRLVEASTDRKFWAEEFEGPIDGLHDLQGRISRSIAGAIMKRYPPPR
jgi:TolB-like protein